MLFFESHCTSEYGSADPSPTMPFPQVEDNTSFTDGDSDTDSAMPSHLIRHYEKEMRKLKRKARDYKEKAISYKEESHQYRHVMNGLYARVERYEESLQREQNVSRQLNSRLREANIKINELKRIIGERQDLATRNLCPTCTYSGAGEAMCSRTELHMNSPSSNLNFNQLANNSVPLNIKNSMFTPRFSQNNDSADEIKNFRTIESGSDRDQEQNENIEPARDASTNSYLIEDDHGFANKRPVPIIHEDKLILSNVNEGYAEFLNNLAKNRENTDETIQLSLDGDGQESVTSSTMTPMKMRRSFSDTDLNTLAQMQIEQNNRSPLKLNKRPCTPMKRYRSAMLHRKNRKFRGFSTDDDTSSLSSDEELMKVIEKQLRRKGGDVVRFRPPRKAVTKKFYSRFGPNERNALEQFEYLHDLTTDVSGLGSPDPSPKPPK